MLDRAQEKGGGEGEREILTSGPSAPSTQLPQNEAQGIHVHLFERLKGLHVDGFVQDLRRHVPLRALLGVCGDVHLILVLEHGQAKVSNAAGHVVLDQDVLGLHVPVSDGRLGLCPKQLRVEMSKPAARGYRHLEHHLWGHGLLNEEVVERPKLVVLSDEPQLRDSVVGDHVTGKESENVVVTQEERVVDLGLPTPRFLVAGEEFLHGDGLPLVVAEVDLAVATVPDEFRDLDGAGDRPLDEEGET